MNPVPDSEHCVNAKPVKGVCGRKGARLDRVSDVSAETRRSSFSSLTPGSSWVPDSPKALAPSALPALAPAR